MDHVYQVGVPVVIVFLVAVFSPTLAEKIAKVGFLALLGYAVYFFILK